MPFVTLAQLESVKVDYLVVGGGTSGLTLATRLSEIPEITVLVIEAGADHGSVPEIDIPGMFGRAIANSKYDWSFLSVPQKHANNQVVLQPRGKGLGGSSLLNFLGFFRPSKPECDALEELGNEGWNWESLLHYMKKSENTIPVTGLTEEQAKLYAAVPETGIHGIGGPVYKSMRQDWTDAHAKLFETAAALGIPRNPESGKGINIGSMSAFSSINPRTTTRSYATTAYLRPNIQRQNLLVLTEAHVAKILFKESKGLLKADGVEVIKDRIATQIEDVRREVIICAGALQTPQILELSGIGNPGVLAQFGVCSLVDLPGVGENLQDHVSVFTLAEIDSPDETFDVIRDPELLKKHEELYKEGRGHFAYGPAPGYIFLSARHLGDPKDITAWYQQAMAEASEGLAHSILPLQVGLEKQYNFQGKYISDENHAVAEILQYIGHPMVPNSEPAPGKQYTALLCAFMHPFSRGSVHIASSDPLEPPAVDPNYLASKVDLDVLVQIVRFAHQLYCTPPLSNIVKAQILPPPDILDNEERLREYIKDQCKPVFHPVGTAAMLPRDCGGVVDKDLRVYGTSNLRIADLSIVPLELSCHTQSIAYAIGEKAADIIKAEIC